MNYIRTEVTGTPVDQRYSDAELAPPGGPSHTAGRTMQQFLGSVAVDARPAPSGRKVGPFNGLAPWQVLRVRDYVESTLAQAIQVACLARIAKLSPSHFARAFRVSFGSTPAAYIVARRVERAKLMMLGTSESLSRISLDCGFTDQSHLSRAFRRQVGESPSRWRRWHRSA